MRRSQNGSDTGLSGHVSQSATVFGRRLNEIDQPVIVWQPEQLRGKADVVGRAVTMDARDCCSVAGNRMTDVQDRSVAPPQRSGCPPARAFLDDARTGNSYIVRMIRLAAAAAALAIGLLVLSWAGYAYSVAARGAAGDLTATGWSIYATGGVLLGGGFIFVSWRVIGRGQRMRSLRLGTSDFLLVAGLIVLLMTLLFGVPGHALGFVVATCTGLGLIAYGLTSWAVRRIGR